MREVAGELGAASILDGLPDPLVPRPRLIELLQRPTEAAVTLIVAGAGYGKTTLAVEAAAASTRRVGWLSLREADDEASRLVSRLHAVLPGGLGATDHPADRHRPPTSRLDGDADALWADLARLDRPSCLILDNVDWLADPACVDLLDGLIARLPAALSLVLVSRTTPPVRLGRLRSQGQVRELGATDLGLTEEEATGLLCSLAPAGLGGEDIRRVWRTAEGWITGVRLAGLAMTQAARRDPLRDWLTARDAYLDEYVQQEIVAPLPPDLQQFVLATADFPFVFADLCDEALGIGNSDEAIARLDRELGFLVPVVARPDHYRYHRLVGESLRRLGAAVTLGHARRARRQEAAVSLLSTENPRDAAEPPPGTRGWQGLGEAIEPLCRWLAERSDLEALVDWLDRVPDAVVEANPNLSYWDVVARLGLGRTFGVRQALDAAEPRWRSAGEPLRDARIAFCRGMLAFWEGWSQEAERRLTDALARLPEDAHMERLQAATVLGRAAFREGRDVECAVALDAAVGHAVKLPTDEQWSWRVLAPDRANARALRGDLPSAITTYRMILSELPPAQSHLAGLYRCRLIGLLIERNELEAAARELEVVEGLMGDERRAWYHDAWIAKGWLLLASGRPEEAERWAVGRVKDLRRLPERNQLVLLLASIELERGELSMVRSWLRDVDTLRYPWAQVFGDVDVRTLSISLSLAEGNAEAAADAARRLTAEAATTRRWAEFVGLSTRWAIALHQLGRIGEAREALAPALERGAKGGFVRSFHVPGVDAAWVSADLWGASRGALRMKDALQDIVAGAPDGSESMLSGREVEVLRLVAQGRSNQQIADGMYISINTVRNHLVRISRRLEASSRSEAVAKARRLGILD